MTVKYYVYYLNAEDCKHLKTFEDKKLAFAYVKDDLKNTDGSFALQIVGYDTIECKPIFTKTYTAVSSKAKAI